MNWQYIIVSLIGIATIAIVLHKLWRLFLPKENGGSCDACNACRGKR